MKIRVFILLTFIVAIFNCCDHKKDLQRVLSINCYWDIIEKGSPHPLNSCYRFDITGKCNFFYYNFYNKKRTDSVFLYDDGDVIVPNTWALENDSSISIRGIAYTILQYNSDSVFLRSLGNDTVILIKNCKTFNPKDKISK